MSVCARGADLLTPHFAPFRTRKRLRSLIFGVRSPLFPFFMRIFAAKPPILECKLASIPFNET